MAAVLAVIAGVVVYATTRPGTPDRRAVASALTATASAPTTVPPTPVRTGPPRERVAAAAPVSFRIKGPAFDIKAGVCQMPYVRPLDPPGDQLHTVCWVKDRAFGVAPGSHSGGTSYILGHAWAEQRLVLNPLSEYAMREVNLARPTMRDGVKTYPIKHLNGYRITLRTPNGVLTYTVGSALAVGKNDAAAVHSVMATKTPNRVVLITCGVSGGVDVDVNVIVFAYLTSSVSTRT